MVCGFPQIGELLELDQHISFDVVSDRIFVI